MTDFDQVCAHCGEGSRPGDPLWTRFGSAYHVTCRTPPPAMRDLVDEDATAPRVRSGVEARAYGHRGSSPELSDGTPPSTGSSEPTSVGPGASPVASRSAVEVGFAPTDPSPSAEPTVAAVSALVLAEVATSATGSEAGVVPAAPSHDDVPLRRGDSDSATPAAAGPGESSAVDVYQRAAAAGLTRCGVDGWSRASRMPGRLVAHDPSRGWWWAPETWRSWADVLQHAPRYATEAEALTAALDWIDLGEPELLPGALSPTPQQKAGPQTSGASVLGGGVGDLGDPECPECGGTGIAHHSNSPPDGVPCDRCDPPWDVAPDGEFVPPSPDPAAASSSVVGGAGSGDLAAWDRSLEGAELEQELAALRSMRGCVLALAAVVADAGMVRGSTVAELIRRIAGGGE